MSKITVLNDKLSNLDKTLEGLEKIRREKENAIMTIQQKMMELNAILEKEKGTLEDSIKKIESTRMFEIYKIITKDKHLSNPLKKELFYVQNSTLPS